MKALVTGGAGFIGSNICKLLRSEGHDVVVIDSLLSGYRRNLDFDPDIRFIEADIRDQQAMETAVENCDVVFHLAAAVGNKRSIDDPRLDADINAMGTVTLMESARKAGVKRVVVSSSAGIFGELKTLPISEDHPIDPDSPYGASKLFEEKFALSYSKLYDIGVVALRYFNVYGVNQRFDAYGNVIPIFAYRMLRGEPVTVFGDGEQTRDFVNVRDVAQANYQAGLAEGVSGAFNLGSATRITINALIDMMQEASGISAKVEYGPPRPGDVRDSLADISAARASLGFSPSADFENGLREYMTWLKADMKD
ncbi:SDR family NAD(P)-dependent oxidoreductase [uncultured Hoeflea sp.]|uniref:SDR family NAD(P)-dependent oxidoreductase n=1 Tax=uncultured Hoeflea sp. TaxID=538666 RepID=UPI0026136CC0|nr:SDR family NAD(P)-dependent oxidoreductase [uncultured Hoeflea sp.]